MNDSFSTYCTIIYLLDALRTVFVVTTWRAGVRPLLLQAYAAALALFRRLPRPCLLFNVLQNPLRRCPLGDNAQDRPIHIYMPLRYMVGVRSRCLYAQKVAEMPNTFQDAVRALQVGKGGHFHLPKPVDIGYIFKGVCLLVRARHSLRASASVRYCTR